MKLSLSFSDRIGSDYAPYRQDRSAGRWLILGGLVPFTVVAVAASAWYVVTGQTPLDLLEELSVTRHVSLPMPPPLAPVKSTAALLRPPSLPAANDPDVHMAVTATAPATPPPTAPLTTSAATPPTAAMAASEPAAPTTPVVAPPTIAGPANPPTRSPVATPAPMAAASPPPVPALPTPPLPATDDTPLPEAGGPPPSFAQLPSPKAEAKPLTPGPLPELLRNTGRGPIPIMAGERVASKAYARPFRGDTTKPRIAIVVVGLGLSKEATLAAITKLPPDVSLSFSPYGSGLSDWVRQAREKGHEVLIDLPLETENLQIHDPGPMAVLSNQSPGEAIDHLESILVRMTSYVGIAGALHSPEVAADSWTAVLQDLRNRGLLFIGDGLVGVPDTAMPEAASVTLVADETPFRGAIDAHLGRLLAAAQRDGTAIAYLSPRPASFERLIAWANTLADKGAILAPVSAVVRPKP